MVNTQWLAPACCSSAQRGPPHSFCSALSGRNGGQRSTRLYMPTKPWLADAGAFTVNRRLKSPAAMRNASESHRQNKTNNAPVDASHSARTPEPQFSQGEGSDFDDLSSSRAAEIAADDVIVLLLAVAVGLSTGMFVVGFNTFVHLLQDEVVWTDVPRLAAFGAQGLQRADLPQTGLLADGVWLRCLVLPPVFGGGFVALLRQLVGGFSGDPKSVAVRSSQRQPPASAVKLAVTLSSPASKPSLIPRHSGVPRIPSLPYVGVTRQKGVAVSTRVPVIAARRKPSVPDTPLSGARGFMRDLIQDVRRQGLQATARPYVKLVAAAVTLGSGASLGPEGPSVDVGKANAARITCAARERRAHVMTDLVAAGAGAGVAAGFGAPMSGVLFAVETVLLSTSAAGTAVPPEKHDDESGVLIASVLVACVCASIVSQAGLGLEPAFQIPPTAPLSVHELPLCVIEGLLCGSAAAGLGLATANSEASFLRLRSAGVPTTLIPVIGGLACGSLAVLFPEISYQGFDNLNALFQFDGRQSVESTAAGLAALVLVKIAGTAVCRGSGLVGGVYAPALFIGAALGKAFWHIADGTMIAVASTAPHLHLAFDGIELASANTYALVGAAAMLAAFCRVPLTAVLLLFELTQDYTLFLPTLMAVGFAQWGAATAPKFLR